MFWLKTSCIYCRKELKKGEGIIKEVRIYGRVGARKKTFCNPDHLEAFEEMQSHLFRHQKVCTTCTLAKLG